MKNSHTSNSDVFIGVSKNKAVTDKFIFNGYSLGSASDRLALKPMADIAGAADITGLDRLVFAPEMNGSAYYPALPDYEEWKVFNATGDWAALTKAEVFALGWNTVSTESVLPAANFIKTQYQIESIDIPSLIALRDQFFTSNPDLYRYPDGTPSNLTSSLNYDELPESMRLANNDDPRWSNYYFDWVRDLPSPAVFAAQYAGEYPISQTALQECLNVVRESGVSTIQRGYQVQGAASFIDAFQNSVVSVAEIQDQVSSIVNSSYSLTPLTSGPSSYPDSDGVRQMREMWIGWGDDRFGAGYHYLGEAGHDSVRMYNNMIANWERMLAKNELEKLNARAFIMNNINSFDDVSEVSHTAGRFEYRFCC